MLGRKAPQADDHHSDVSVDHIPWIIDQWDHNNPLTSKMKHVGPYLVACLCCTTSSPTQCTCISNTTPRSTTMETDGHPSTPTMAICSRPSSGSFLVAIPLCSISPSPIARHTHGTAWSHTIHGELPFSIGGVIVPRPEDPADPSLAIIDLTPAWLIRASLLSRKMIACMCP